MKNLFKNWIQQENPYRRGFNVDSLKHQKFWVDPGQGQFNSFTLENMFRASSEWTSEGFYQTITGYNSDNIHVVM